MNAAELERFLTDGVKYLSSCEHGLPPGPAKARVRKVREDLMALKAQHCGGSAREAIESWRSSYQPKRVDRPSPVADAAIRAWRESYPPARREQQSICRSLEAAARVKTFFGHNADPTLRSGASDVADAAIQEFRKNYRG